MQSRVQRHELDFAGRNIMFCWMPSDEQDATSVGGAKDNDNGNGIGSATANPNRQKDEKSSSLREEARSRTRSNSGSSCTSSSSSTPIADFEVARAEEELAVDYELFVKPWRTFEVRHGSDIHAGTTPIRIRQSFLHNDMSFDGTGGAVWFVDFAHTCCLRVSC